MSEQNELEQALTEAAEELSQRSGIGAPYIAHMMRSHLSPLFSRLSQRVRELEAAIKTADALIAWHYHESERSAYDDEDMPADLVELEREYDEAKALLAKAGKAQGEGAQAS